MDVLTEHPDILNIEAFVLYPAKENRQNYSSRRIQQPQMLMRVVYPTPDKVVQNKAIIRCIVYIHVIIAMHLGICRIIDDTLRIGKKHRIR